MVSRQPSQQVCSAAGTWWPAVCSALLCSPDTQSSASLGLASPLPFRADLTCGAEQEQPGAFALVMSTQASNRWEGQQGGSALALRRKAQHHPQPTSAGVVTTVAPRSRSSASTSALHGPQNVTATLVVGWQVSSRSSASTSALQVQKRTPTTDGWCDKTRCDACVGQAE